MPCGKKSHTYFSENTRTKSVAWKWIWSSDNRKKMPNIRWDNSQFSFFPSAVAVIVHPAIAKRRVQRETGGPSGHHHIFINKFSSTQYAKETRHDTGSHFHSRTCSHCGNFRSFYSQSARKSVTLWNFETWTITTRRKNRHAENYVRGEKIETQQYPYGAAPGARLSTDVSRFPSIQFVRTLATTDTTYYGPFPYLYTFRTTLREDHWQSERRKVSISQQIFGEATIFCCSATNIYRAVGEWSRERRRACATQN